METAIKLIHFFINGKMYGEITIKFENGRIVMLEKKEKLKL